MVWVGFLGPRLRAVDDQFVFFVYVFFFFFVFSVLLFFGFNGILFGVLMVIVG